MTRILKIGALIGVLAVGAGLWITQPKTVDPSDYVTLTGDAENGALVFAATGCASCHSNAATGSELGGGKDFASDFGVFYAPNISQDAEQGIGSWDLVSFASAMTKGTSPDGTHYYPAFPYTSYALMAPQDVADLYTYLQTTSADSTPSRPHDIAFPFNLRITLGGWKLLFTTSDYMLDVGDSPAAQRGRYLVEAMGHCAECHTPRNALGGLQRSAWMAGGPNPSGSGRIPNITPSEAGIGGWSEDEIVEYFATGFTPDFDVVGGSMGPVQENLAKLPEEDLRAIATYLKLVPAID
ncbi:MAG: cytochrome c [Pseudomonadota bacterium]